MHTISTTKTHRVERTACGRFAVIRPDGGTVAEVLDQALALMCAAQLDAEPVRQTEVARTEPANEKANRPRAVMPLGRWNNSLAA